MQSPLVAQEDQKQTDELVNVTMRQKVGFLVVLTAHCRKQIESTWAAKIQVPFDDSALHSIHFDTTVIVHMLASSEIHSIQIRHS